MIFHSATSIVTLLLGAAEVFGQAVDHGHHHHGHYHHDHRDLTEIGRSCGYEEPSDEERAEIARIVGGQESRIYEQFETIQIKTYFHILMESSGEGNISDATVSDQMSILNKAFSGTQNPDYPMCDDADVEYNSTAHTRTPFVFNLIETYRWADDAWFDMSNGDSEIKQEEVREGDCSTLNIYSGKPANGALGIATRPLVCGDNLEKDGARIHYQTVPGGEFENFNQGDTLVHEVGHWLGLDHTFQNGCDEKGDSIDDTPAQGTSTSGCPVNKNSCRDIPGFDPIHNFMDYSDDCCMYQFTPGQTQRMQRLANKFRSLKGVPPSIAPSESPTEIEIPAPLVVLAIGLVEFFNLPPGIIELAQNLVDFLETTFASIFGNLLD